MAQERSCPNFCFRQTTLGLDGVLGTSYSWAFKGSVGRDHTCSLRNLLEWQASQDPAQHVLLHHSNPLGFLSL